ncbi:hypothetical protein [Photobacterium kishitanii]|uniref:Uncharacterized protein n=1 Tax=Photobacterium kishitanii TaxID=318456 RepID=A0A2T3KMK4_9GAMM|nr:hypothetical protein [Photobacterium kishitanii]PSV01026.1 hypothetical protein C9J27_03080 [Photobacterium kishitanii]
MESVLLGAIELICEFFVLTSSNKKVFIALASIIAILIVMCVIGLRFEHTETVTADGEMSTTSITLKSNKPEAHEKGFIVI